MAAPDLNNQNSGETSDEDNEDFGALLEQHLPQKMPRSNGEMVDAIVVRALDDVVLLNYGSKEEAAVPIAEFTDARGLLSVKPGDTVRVQLVGRDEDGNAVFSYKRARQAEALQMLGQAYGSKVPVRGTISRSVNGGVIVDVSGVPAFMPGSQVDVKTSA